MKLICIENKITKDTWIDKSDVFTIGKIYDTIDKYKGMFPVVVNDKGKLMAVDRKRMIPIEEWREKQLENLL